MSEPVKPPEVQLQIQIDDDIANGRYANLALISFQETEFTLDFIYVQPQQPKGKVFSRVITNPRHVKRLVATLQANIAKYEQNFGPIDASEPGTPVH